MIGASAGGIEAAAKILSKLSKAFPFPIVIAQHTHRSSSMYRVTYLRKHSALEIVEGEDKRIAEPGVVVMAPPDYHILVEKDRTLSLSVDERVNYARPSIDVLFESAVDAFGSGVIGIVLTGGNKDGAVGTQRIKEAGGTVLVQTPESAEAPLMPESVLERIVPDFIGDPRRIGEFLNGYTGENDG